ncbi:hypothetical protein AB1L12_09900 [Peribacillus frigoritolerans]
MNMRKRVPLFCTLFSCAIFHVSLYEFPLKNPFAFLVDRMNMKTPIANKNGISKAKRR